MPHDKGKMPDAGFVISGAAAWFLCACMLLCVTTLAANAAGLGERGLGYLASINSFLSALAAGAAAARRSGTSRLLTALITGTALVILLLTIGFLTEGEHMDPSSILSVVSFTYAGILVGTFFRGNPGRHGSKPLFHLKR